MSQDPPAPRAAFRDIPARAALAALAALAACLPLPTARAAAPQDAPLEEVLVTGEQPGPGMWRVTDADGRHELWILGMLEPLPKAMRWQSHAVEATIARSQEVLAPPAIKLHVGFLKTLTLLPAALRARKNADGATLQATLPPALYARWLALKERYIGADVGIERLRPLIAAAKLYRRALDRNGLTSEPVVWTQVKRAAAARRVLVRAVDYDLTVEDPRGTLREFEKIPRDPDVACLERTMERIEGDLGTMRRRADLWARGDLDGIRRLPYPDVRAACVGAVGSVPELKVQLDAARDRLLDTWVAAVRAALERNASTVAVASIEELNRPGGWLDALRARGLLVHEP